MMTRRVYLHSSLQATMASQIVIDEMEVGLRRDMMIPSNLFLAAHRQGYRVTTTSYGKWLGNPVTLSMCSWVLMLRSVLRNALEVVGFIIFEKWVSFWWWKTPFAIKKTALPNFPTYKKQMVVGLPGIFYVILFWCNGNLFRENFDVFKQAIAKTSLPLWSKWCFASGKHKIFNKTIKDKRRNIHPGSPKTKLCPLVVGNPLHGSS